MLSYTTSIVQLILLRKKRVSKSKEKDRQRNDDIAPSITTVHPTARIMAYIASLASLASTPLVPSQTAALASVYANANTSAHPVQIADLARYDNMNTKDFNRFAYSLNYTQTGCFSQGALPVALASEDICLPGWYCT